MSIHPHVLINLVLAVLTLVLYVVGSRRFRLDRQPFLIFLVAAVLLDIATAILASFGITPTTQLPFSDPVPWKSKLFLTHIILSNIGFFGFIAVTVTLLVRGTRRQYTRLRLFQYRLLLPVWLAGQGIALANTFAKALFQYRLYDHL